MNGKNGKIKSVLKHLKKDYKEFNSQIKDDKKLKKVLLKKTRKEKEDE